MPPSRIYLSPPHISDEGYELEFMKDAFASNWIAPLGPHVDAFEREFAVWHSMPYAAALSSGTAALHLALILLGVQHGDEVICSTFTFSATANAISYVNAKPVFIDSDAATWNMSPDLLADALRHKAAQGKLPKAAIIVDIIGQSADWKPLTAICEKFGVPIIEDAAEALGATYNGKQTGRFGKLAAFSFNGNKIITTSGGGMLVSDDEELIKKARFLSTQSRDPAIHYEHSQIGYNYRLSNVLAAIGRGQLKVLAQRVEQKRAIFDYYSRSLSDLPGIEFMPEPKGFRSTRWLTCLTVDPAKFGAGWQDIYTALNALNIESRPLWKPMHLQPVFADCEFVGGSVSESLFANGLCLPSGTALREDQLEQICDIVRKRCRA
ncbi:MAG: aminotransferase class I/II-fold pyridoxal phosphate-dependent enzyme [Calditrichaeota bacterium]|nr:aminotransferase class I/II-fold pyridoxal phosphate-dependent enzyme [Calditrichota bacterium]